ncbi:MAG TPA: creatininase family protein [Thermomicrobiales bacterium]|jgi:creatinine amidohydrolase|nr:creatininase family protein [Thermomicrobiales bacterium]
MSLLIWNESTRDEIRAVIADAVVVLPTGATEQHGPHLVTGHDTFAVGEIARRAAARAAERTDVILAPALPFGSSDHHLPFGGTLSLATETYGQVIRDLVRSMIAGGARRVFLLNGHGGNRELNQLVARDVAREQPLDKRVAIAAASYWEIADAALAAAPEFASVRRPGHAGLFETATMLAMDPRQVREPRPVRPTDTSAVPVIPGTRIEMTGMWQRHDGWTDHPARATATQGERALATIVDAVTAALIDLAAYPLESRPGEGRPVASPAWG